MPDKLKSLVPNSVTMMALICGVSSIHAALGEHWSQSVFLIMLSVVFDFMDGKVARWLKVASRFGAELDSLSDFVSFGVAPGILMYLWVRSCHEAAVAAGEVTSGGIPWLVSLFVAVCCAARLARFNSMLDVETPSYWTHFFTGVPAPAGGGLVMLPLVMWLACRESVVLFTQSWFVSAFMVFAGAMMASRIPTFCLKHLHLGKVAKTLVTIVLALFVIGLILAPWKALSILGIGYILSIPLGIVMFCRFRLAAASDMAAR